MNGGRSLVLLLIARGRAAEAEPIARAVLDSALRLYGPQHPETGRAMVTMADLLLARGDFEAAEPLARQALETRQASLPRGHRLIGLSRMQLADALSHSTEPVALAEADRLIEQALSDYRDYRVVMFWATAYAASIRGATLAARGQFEAAQDVLCWSYDELLRMRGARSAETRAAAQRLVRLYEAWDRPDSAAFYRERAAAPRR